MLKQKNGIIHFGFAAMLIFITTSASDAEEVAKSSTSSAAVGSNDYYLNTRPIASGLKSINEALQAISGIKDSAKQIVALCTKDANSGGSGLEEDFYSSRTVVTGLQKTAGKYYKAPIGKLLQLTKEIDRQRAFIAETLTENQNDQRDLRASDKTRVKIAELRHEARDLNKIMLEDTNRVNSLIATPKFDQDELTSRAKALTRSSAAVESKLQEMAKVLKREKS